jgi:cation transport protein ChaC
MSASRQTTPNRHGPEPMERRSARPDLAWFFGYGSLMWRPGFHVDAFEPARLDYWHRRFCIVSRHYRGTPDRPGLVLGLAPGGTCVGRALGVQRSREPEVLAYLDEREQVGGIYVYQRCRLPLFLPAYEAEVEAWCYVARPDHPDFTGDLADDEILARIASARGRAGSNRDYALNTVAHLAEMGIVEPGLTALAERLLVPEA